MKYAIKFPVIFAGHVLVAAAALFTLSPVVRADGNCGAQPHCFDAGPFVAEITSTNPSWNNTHNRQYLRLNLRLRNTSGERLILGFQWGSAATLTDNYGNAYLLDGNDRTSVSGIGLIERSSADANFVLTPGASRNASLIFNRWIGKSGSAAAVGNTFTADFSLAQMQVLPGSQRIEVAGQYSLNFPDLRSALIGTGAIDSLGEGIGNVLSAFSKRR